MLLDLWKYLCHSQLLGQRGDHGYFGLVGEKGEASFSGEYCLFMSFMEIEMNSLVKFYCNSKV